MDIFPRRIMYNLKTITAMCFKARRYYMVGLKYLKNILLMKKKKFMKRIRYLDFKKICYHFKNKNIWFLFEYFDVWLFVKACWSFCLPTSTTRIQCIYLSPLSPCFMITSSFFGLSNIQCRITSLIISSMKKRRIH